MSGTNLLPGGFQTGRRCRHTVFEPDVPTFENKTISNLSTVQPIVYTVSRLAANIGLGSDLIRHYTEKGLITPYVDPSNGYRYYGSADALAVMDARTLREFDFSVAQAGEFLRSDAPAQIASLEACQTNLRAQIEALEAKVHRLDQILAFRRLADHCTGTVEAVMRKSIHSVYTMGIPGKDYAAARHVVKEWARHFPFTHISIRIPQNELNDPDFTGAHRSEVGLGIVEEHLARTGLGPGPEVESIPGGRHLILLTVSKSLERMDAEVTRPLRRYIAEHGLRCTNNSSGRLLASETIEGERRHAVLIRVRVAPAGEP